MKAYALLNSHLIGSPRAACDKKLEVVVQYTEVSELAFREGECLCLNESYSRPDEAGTLGVSILKRKWDGRIRFEKRLAGYA
jgi:hypothetical protein